MNAARKSIVVNAPVTQVYRGWLRGEDFPKFITAIKESRRLDESHFAVSESLNGERHDSVLEFVLRIPERRLVWRSLSDQLAVGVVTFTPRRNRTTGVSLTMMSTYGGAVPQRVADYLQNFKKLIEGECSAVTRSQFGRQASQGPFEELLNRKFDLKKE
jgi:uncharacterized membrane protein